MVVKINNLISCLRKVKTYLVKMYWSSPTIASEAGWRLQASGTSSECCGNASSDCKMALCLTLGANKTEGRRYLTAVRETSYVFVSWKKSMKPTLHLVSLATGTVGAASSPRGLPVKVHCVQVRTEDEFNSLATWIKNYLGDTKVILR